jgi:ankyrin repeat protein
MIESISHKTSINSKRFIPIVIHYVTWKIDGFFRLARRANVEGCLSHGEATPSDGKEAMSYRVMGDDWYYCFGQFFVFAGWDMKRIHLSNDKRRPHYPSKDETPAEKLNGVVENEGTLLTCIDLATAVSMLVLNDKNGKVDMRKFGSEEAIRQNVLPKGNKELLVKKAYIENNDNFGNRLADMFVEMRNQGETKKTLQISSGVHRMSMWLIYENKGEGEERCLVYFYDPTVTNKIVRTKHKEESYVLSKRLKLEVLRQQTLKDYIDLTSEVMNLDVYPQYYPHINENVSVILELANAEGEIPNCSMKKVESMPNGKPVPLVMYYLLTHNYGGTMVELLEQIRTLPRNEQFNILKAMNSKGVGGLLMALQEGNADAIKSYGVLLKELQIPLEKIVILLDVKNESGTSGLYSAMQNNNVNCIISYFDLLNEFNVPLENKTKLFTAKDDEDCPGLFMALQEGHNDVIEVYLKQLIVSKIEFNDVVNMLVAKDKSGFPGAFLAFQNEHFDSIEIYIKFFRDLNIPPKKIIELLAIKTDIIVNGDPNLENEYGDELDIDNYNQYLNELVNNEEIYPISNPK